VKSKHLGLGLNLHRSHCLHRIEILLLITALAHCLLFLTGLQARKSTQRKTRALIVATGPEVLM
jgi:hypothetical protein